MEGISRKEAIERGFTIDNHCYPNIAYKGPRFDPDEHFRVMTEQEEILVDLLNKHGHRDNCALLNGFKFCDCGIDHVIAQHDINKSLSEGDKVTYLGPGGKKEHGIIKEYRADDSVFVVYNCGDDWENYKDYTGAMTRSIDLVKGWV